MSLLDAFERVVDHVPVEFVAPVPDAETVSVFSLQGGVPYWFELHDPTPGWWHVIPSSKSRAGLGDAVEVSERLNYLWQLEKFAVLTLFPVSATTWLVVPFNEADAMQRGWQNSGPRLMYLVAGSLSGCDVVKARNMAGILLYDCPLHLYQYLPVSRELFAKRIIEGHLIEMRKRRAELEAEERKASVEDRARWQLGFMGATLLDWRELGSSYEVTWEHEGATWTMPLTRDLRIESAGICLAGTDGQHNLSSIVEIMQTGRKLKRYDMPEEYYT